MPSPPVTSETAGEHRRSNPVLREAGGASPIPTHPEARMNFMVQLSYSVSWHNGTTRYGLYGKGQLVTSSGSLGDDAKPCQEREAPRKMQTQTLHFVEEIVGKELITLLHQPCPRNAG